MAAMENTIAKKHLFGYHSCKVPLNLNQQSANDGRNAENEIFNCFKSWKRPANLGFCSPAPPPSFFENKIS